MEVHQGEMVLQAGEVHLEVEVHQVEEELLLEVEAHQEGVEQHLEEGELHLEVEVQPLEVGVQ